MKSKSLFWLLATFFLTTASITDAQQPGKIFRIAYLQSGSPSGSAHLLEAFRQGLRDLGYIEGQNIIIEYRYAAGSAQLPDLAAELVRLKVDVIVTRATSGALSAKQASGTISIVIVNVGDPVGAGLVASLARPGGNITGLTQMAPEVGSKRLELLKEVVPGLSRVAVLGSANAVGAQLQRKEIEAAARTLDLRLQPLEVGETRNFETAFQALGRGRGNGLLLQAGPLNFAHRTKIVEAAAKSRLPAIYPQSEYVEAGGLMSYAPNNSDMYRRAATYVDKILKGARPADLPIEQPTKFEFVINLKAAKQIGLTIPPNVLARADKVIR